MASFSQVVLVGHLTRDPEVKAARTGTAYSIIGLAINDKRKQGDEWIEETSYVDVMVSGRLAEVAGDYLKKGSMALFSGRLKMDSWEKDGQKVTRLKVIADSMQILSPKEEKASGGRVTPERQYNRASKPSSSYAEDVPF